MRVTYALCRGILTAMAILVSSCNRDADKEADRKVQIERLPGVVFLSNASPEVFVSFKDFRLVSAAVTGHEAELQATEAVKASFDTRLCEYHAFIGDLWVRQFNANSEGGEFVAIYRLNGLRTFDPSKIGYFGKALGTVHIPQTAVCDFQKITF